MDIRTTTVASNPGPVLVQPTTTLKVPPARARALALALARGVHPWVYQGPLCLPEDPGSLEAALAAADTTDEWCPQVSITDGEFRWTPCVRGYPGVQREIVISATGIVLLTVGRNQQKSAFLGGVAVAVAGGMDSLPQGLVRIQ